jgi:uncharacterized Zn-finger protein
MHMSLAHEYLVTPPSSSRDRALPFRRHHSTPSWGVQTPTPQYYYASAADMYPQFSNCTDSSYPITPVSDEEYRSQYAVQSPPHSTNSSPQSSGTITTDMLRSMPGMPPSPLATPLDVVGHGLSHSCAFPGCTFVSTDVENIRRHVMSYHPAPKTVSPPSLVMDDNGVASVSFMKREPSLPLLQEFEEGEMYNFDLSQYPMSSPYAMTCSNTMPVSTPTRTPVAVPQVYQPYAPMTPASYPRNHTHSLSDPSMAASLALLPTHSYMSPPTPPSRDATPLSRSLSRSSRAPPSLPLVVSALDKSHVCEVCQKRFKRLEHLRRHNKTHTGERGFRCEVVGCGKWFSRSDNLMAHRRYSSI